MAKGIPLLGAQYGRVVQTRGHLITEQTLTVGMNDILSCEDGSVPDCKQVESAHAV